MRLTWAILLVQAGGRLPAEEARRAGQRAQPGGETRLQGLHAFFGGVQHDVEGFDQEGAGGVAGVGHQSSWGRARSTNDQPAVVIRLVGAGEGDPLGRVGLGLAFRRREDRLGVQRDQPGRQVERVPQPPGETARRAFGGEQQAAAQAVEQALPERQPAARTRSGSGPGCR